MNELREHARELITVSADEGLRNLRAQLERAKEAHNLYEIAYCERRIKERLRFLERIKQ